MVEEYIIKKTLNDAILKCSQGYRLHDGVVKAFNSFHEETCGTKKKIRKTEKGLVTDSEGHVLYTPKGDKNEVNLDWSKVHELYDEYGELHFTHNHPRDGVRPVAECLSSGDVACLFNTYRPYGKRPDGSEGYLVDENGIYPIKSMSCESANGSRMTLVRGDNFKHENEREARKLGVRLSDYWAEYDEKYYETANKIGRQTNPNDFENYRDYERYVYKEAIKELGVFQDNKEFKDIQKGFISIDCRLNYTFPFDYMMGMQEGLII